MNKRGIIVAIVIFIIIGTSFFIKEQWKETMNTFGPLNIMETDDIETLSENRTSSSFSLSGKQDYYLSGSITVNKGNASCVITCDGTIIYENNFDKGNYQIKTDEFSNKTGKINVEIAATDDVEGDYNISIYTRESKFNHFIRRMKEYF